MTPHRAERGASRHLTRRALLTRASLLAMSGLGLVAACNSDQLTVPNYNSPTPSGIGSALTTVQLEVNGVLSQLRAQYSGFISGTGIMGRESYNYTVTEGRNTTCWLNIAQDYACGAGSAFWNGFYTGTRDVYNLIQAADAATTLSAQQKAGVEGFGETFEAYNLGFIAERGINGGPVDQYADPTKLAPFVSRDSLYNYIIGRLDDAKSKLQSAGSSFAFTLPSAMFGGFDTPTSFIKFNRALAARYNVERASPWAGNQRDPACGNNGVTCYTQALQNLTESFIDAGNLSAGPVFTYSTAAGDLTNGLSNASAPFVFAHPSWATDAPLRSDGSKDLRYQAKFTTMSSCIGTGSAVPGICTTQDFKIFSGQSDPIPMITSEELVLIRAEAEWFTGAKAAAIADINLIRSSSGGLGPSSLTTGSSDDQFVTELLLQRRYSLAFTGHRWVDVRRFGKLSTLPIDVPPGAVAGYAGQGTYQDLLIPQGECLARANAGGTKPPTCP